LTFAAGRRVSQGAVGSNVHGITVGGELGLPSGATYVVESEDGKVGTLTIDESAVLTLGAGVLAGSDASNTTTAETRSSLVLTGATGTDGAVLAGQGTLVAGATTITGGAESGTWQAVDTTGASTVTIEADRIEASAATVSLTGTTDNGAVINVTGATLTVVGQIDIGTKGTVTLTGNDDGTGGSLLLKGGTVPGALRVSGESTNVTIGTATNALTPAGGTDNTDAAVTKDGAAVAAGIVVTGAADETTTTLGTIGGGTTAGDNDATITGSATSTNAATIVSGWKFILTDVA
jgi:hypothetical protein